MNVSQKRKVKLCSELGKDGFLIRPRRSPHTFCKGKCTVNFYQLERAMLYANIQCLRIAIYGMKIPVCDIIANDAAKCVRYDIGHNVNTSDIPIFLE